MSESKAREREKGKGEPGKKEEKEGGKGERAEGRGGRKAREEERACSPLCRVCGADSRAPPPPTPLRAAQLALCRGRWRGAGGRGAPGLWGGETIPSAKGGLAASKASPDANQGPGLGRVGCRGARWGVGG